MSIELKAQNLVLQKLLIDKNKIIEELNTQLEVVKREPKTSIFSTISLCFDENFEQIEDFSNKFTVFLDRLMIENGLIVKEQPVGSNLENLEFVHFCMAKCQLLIDKTLEVGLKRIYITLKGLYFSLRQNEVNSKIMFIKKLKVLVECPNQQQQDQDLLYKW
jgi:hypothetical protein